MSIKIQLGSEIHRIAKAPEAYNELIEMAQKIFGEKIPPNMIFEYKSADSNTIPISSNEEYSSYMADLSIKSRKVFIVEGKPEEKEKPQNDQNEDKKDNEAPQEEQKIEVDKPQDSENQNADEQNQENKEKGDQKDGDGDAQQQKGQGNDDDLGDLSFDEVSLKEQESHIVDENKEKMSKSAVIIQKNLKRWAAQKLYKKQKQSANLISKNFKGKKEMSGFQAMKKAAVKIQANVRKAQAKKVLIEKKEQKRKEEEEKELERQKQLEEEQRQREIEEERQRQLEEEQRQREDDELKKQQEKEEQDRIAADELRKQQEKEEQERVSAEEQQKKEEQDQLKATIKLQGNFRVKKAQQELEKLRKLAKENEERRIAQEKEEEQKRKEEEERKQLEEAKSLEMKKLGSEEDGRQKDDAGMKKSGTAEDIIGMIDKLDRKDSQNQAPKKDLNISEVSSYIEHHEHKHHESAPQSPQFSNHISKEQIKTSMNEVFQANIPSLMGEMEKLLAFKFDEQRKQQEANQQNQDQYRQDPKLRAILKIICDSYKLLPDFHRDEVNEALGGGLEQLLKYQTGLLKQSAANSQPSDNKHHLPGNDEEQKANNNMGQSQAHDFTDMPYFARNNSDKPKFDEKGDKITNDHLPDNNQNGGCNQAGGQPQPQNPDAQNAMTSNNNNQGAGGSDIQPYKCVKSRDISTIPINVTTKVQTIYKTISLKNTGCLDWPKESFLEPINPQVGKIARLSNVKTGKEYSSVLVLNNPGRVGTFTSYWKFGFEENGSKWYSEELIEVNVEIKDQIGGGGAGYDLSQTMPNFGTTYSTEVVQKAEQVKAVFNWVDMQKLKEFISKNPNMNVDQIVENHVMK